MTKRKNPKLYTGQGDTGSTRLMYSSRWVPKCNFRVKALAAFEVAFSQIAVALQYEWRPNIAIALKRLRKLGAELGTHPDHLQDFHASDKYAALDEGDVQEIEEWIDDTSKDIEIPHAFVFADTPEAAALDLARSQVRVLETFMSALLLDDEVCDNAAVYVNRLSDWLFALARYVEQEHVKGWSKMLEQSKVK